MSKEQVIGLVGCILLAGGTFLPFVGIFGVSINYIEGDGILVLGLAVCAALLFLLNRYIPAGIVIVLATMICLYSTVNISNIDSRGIVQLQIGVFILYLGAIIGFAGAALGFRSKTKSA